MSIFLFGLQLKKQAWWPSNALFVNTIDRKCVPNIDRAYQIVQQPRSIEVGQPAYGRDALFQGVLPSTKTVRLGIARRQRLRIDPASNMVEELIGEFLDRLVISSFGFGGEAVGVHFLSPELNVGFGACVTFSRRARTIWLKLSSYRDPDHAFPQFSDVFVPASFLNQHAISDFAPQLVRWQKTGGNRNRIFPLPIRRQSVPMFGGALIKMFLSKSPGLDPDPMSEIAATPANQQRKEAQSVWILLFQLILHETRTI
jgi:hypothetical protein